MAAAAVVAGVELRPNFGYAACVQKFLIARQRNSRVFCIMFTTSTSSQPTSGQTPIFLLVPDGLFGLELRCVISLTLVKFDSSSFTAIIVAH